MPKHRQRGGTGQDARTHTAGADTKRRPHYPAAVAHRGPGNGRNSSSNVQLDDCSCSSDNGRSQGRGLASRVRTVWATLRGFSSPTAALHTALLFLVAVVLKALKAPWLVYRRTRRVRWLQKRVNALSHANAAAAPPPASSPPASPPPAASTAAPMPGASSAPPLAHAPAASRAAATLTHAPRRSLWTAKAAAAAAESSSRVSSGVESSSESSPPPVVASGVEAPPTAANGEGMEPSPSEAREAERELSSRPSFSGSGMPPLMSESSDGELKDGPTQDAVGCGGSGAGGGRGGSWRRGNLFGALAARVGALEGCFRRVLGTTPRERDRCYDGDAHSDDSECGASSAPEDAAPTGSEPTGRAQSPFFAPILASNAERDGAPGAAVLNLPGPEPGPGAASTQGAISTSLHAEAGGPCASAGSAPMCIDVADEASGAGDMSYRLLPPPPTRFGSAPPILSEGLPGASSTGGHAGTLGGDGVVPYHVARTKAQNKRQAALTAAMLVVTRGGLLKTGGQSRRQSRKKDAAGASSSSDPAHDLEAAEAHVKFLASAELGLNLLAEAASDPCTFDQLKADISAARLIAEEDCERIRQEAAKLKKAEKRQRKKAAADHPDGTDDGAGTSGGGGGGAGVEGRTASDERMSRRGSGGDVAEQQSAAAEGPGSSSSRRRAVAAAAAVVAARNTRAGQPAAAAAAPGGVSRSGRRGRLAGGVAWATGGACPESGVGRPHRRRRQNGSGANGAPGATTIFNYLADGASGDDDDEASEPGAGRQEGPAVSAPGQQQQQQAGGQEEVPYDIGDYDPDAMCVVCMDAECTALLQPCLHVVMCVWCAIKNKEKSGLCPVCRAPIEELYNLEG